MNYAIFSILNIFIMIIILFLHAFVSVLLQTLSKNGPRALRRVWVNRYYMVLLVAMNSLYSIAPRALQPVYAKPTYLPITRVVLYKY